MTTQDLIEFMELCNSIPESPVPFALRPITEAERIVNEMIREKLAAKESVRCGR